MSQLVLTLMSATPTTIYSERCLRQRNQGAVCTYCLDSCQTGALQMAGRNISVNIDRCTGCGACLIACPVECFETDNWSERSLVSTAERVGWDSFDVACKNHPAAEKSSVNGPVIRINTCLSAISPGLWFELGLKYTAHLRLERCSDCLMGRTAQFTRLAVKLASSWLVSTGDEDRLFIQENPREESDAQNRQVISAENPILNRRDFLFGFARSSGPPELALRRLPIKEIEEQKNNKNSPHLPIWLRRLADVFMDFKTDGMPDGCGRKTELKSFNWPAMQVTDSCVACAACSLSCPSGALVTKVVEGYFQHFFTPGICISCGLCDLVCPKDAIERSYLSDPSPFDMRVVADRLIEPCTKCENPSLRNSDQLCFCCGSEPVINSLLDNAKANILTS